MLPWFAVTFQRSIYRRAIKVGLIVGTILVIINHGDALLAGDLSLRRLVKIGLCYVVPYLVSTYASVSALRRLE